MPGGVLDGDGDLPEVLGGDLVCSGGIQTIHTLLGLGPMFIPPQLLQGGVGGGVHEDDRFTTNIFSHSKLRNCLLSNKVWYVTHNLHKILFCIPS